MISRKLIEKDTDYAIYEDIIESDSPSEEDIEFVFKCLGILKLLRKENEGLFKDARD